MAAVDHETRHEALGGQLGLGILDALGVIVGALLSSAQNHEAVWITHGADYGGHTGLGDREEVVRVLDGADGVHGDVERAIGAVLEADGEGQTRGQFTVHLGFGGPRSNRTHGKTVGQELRRDGIQHLTGKGHALVGEIHEQLPRCPQTLVDLEAIVDIRVVDQSLPADGGARLLQIGAHDNQQIILVFFLQLHQSVTVFERHLGVVDRAWADDDEETAFVGVGTLDNGNGFLTALEDSLLRALGQCDLMLKQVGGGKRVVAADWSMALVCAEESWKL